MSIWRGTRNLERWEQLPNGRPDPRKDGPPLADLIETYQAAYPDDPSGGPQRRWIARQLRRWAQENHR
jgi:hypothetical protein